MFSHLSKCLTLCDPMYCSLSGFLSFTISQNLLRFLSIGSVMQGELGFSSVQFSSVAQSCPTLCNPMNRSTPGLHVHHQLQSLHKLMSTESVMQSNYLALCRPLLLLPSIFPSIRVFSNELTLYIRWPMYWSFSFNISPFSEFMNHFL